MMFPYRCCFLLCLLWGSQQGWANDPLHVRIDHTLAKLHHGETASPSDDAEFLRRVTLDLIGRIPTIQETRAFLADESANKRSPLVDKLLASPACDHHLAKFFDVMFMERRPDKHVKRAEWEAYLLQSMRENKPYDQLAREILAADGVEADKRAPVKFFLDREDLAVNLVTRDTARVFFGRDVECAQCHDHPLISDYEQAEYYGVLAFLDRSSLFQPDKKKPAVISEKAEGVVKFKSVFTGDEGTTKPRVPGGVQIAEPVFAKGEEYQVKPAKNVRPIPKFSRRQKLAELATNGQNAAFNKNIVNRLWAMMMGQGLVNPVDLHHPENPPISPELLDLLADEFVAMKFAVKPFLKEIALSETYQRSFQMPAKFRGEPEAIAKTRAQLTAEKDRLQSEQSAFDAKIEKLRSELATHRKALAPLRDQAAKLQTELAAAKKTSEVATNAVKMLQQSLAGKKTLADLLNASAQQAEQAAKALPKDADLIAARDAIAALANTHTAQLAALQKQFTEQTTAKNAADTKLQTLTAQVKSNEAERLKREQLARQSEEQLAESHNEQDAAWTAVEATQKQIDRLKLREEFRTTQKRLQTEQARQAELQKQLTALQTSAASKTKELAENQKTLGGLQQTLTNTNAALTARTTALTQRTQSAQLLAEALSEMETAREKLPQDAELIATIEDLETSKSTHTDEKAAIERDIATLTKTLKTSQTALETLQKTIATTEAAVKTSQAQVAKLSQEAKAIPEKISQELKALEASRVELTTSWTNQFRVAGLEHLSPEQLAWSLLEATGQTDIQRAAAVTAWAKKNPELAKKELTPEQSAARETFIEETVQTKLQPQVNKFLPLFAANAGQPQHEFFATVDQALFFSNGNDVLAWLRPSGTNLTARLRKLTDPKALAEELYLSILTRQPNAEEITDVTTYLATRKDARDQAIQEMAWALLSSAEFRFQH